MNMVTATECAFAINVDNPIFADINILSHRLISEGKYQLTKIGSGEKTPDKYLTATNMKINNKR